MNGWLLDNGAPGAAAAVEAEPKTGLPLACVAGAGAGPKPAGAGADDWLSFIPKGPPANPEEGNMLAALCEDGAGWDKDRELLGAGKPLEGGRLGSDDEVSVPLLPPSSSPPRRFFLLLCSSSPSGFVAAAFC